jgi:hypothetical protein
MTMLYALSFVISALISTGIFAATLYIICDEHDNPFVRGESRASWIKCFGLVVLVGLILLVPSLYGPLLAAALWLIGIMFLFGRTLWQALFVIASNATLGWLAIYVLEYLFEEPWLLPIPFTIIAGLAAWYIYRRRRRPEAEPSCPVCGYCLRGLTARSSCCPECGTAIRLSQILASEPIAPAARPPVAERGVISLSGSGWRRPHPRS